VSLATALALLNAGAEVIEAVDGWVNHGSPEPTEHLAMLPDLTRNELATEAMRVRMLKSQGA
jgi:hypothetical protein